MDTHTENVHQMTLRSWIEAGLSIPGVRDLHGDAGYLLNNMIAKYSLAADTYQLSEGAEQEMRTLGVDFQAVHKRRSFYGKKQPFIYEHPVPAGVVRNELLAGNHPSDALQQLLVAAGPVAVLLRTEDQRLKEAKLDRTMPAGWKLGDNPFARYDAVGIRLSQRQLKVTGAICR